MVKVEHHSSSSAFLTSLIVLLIYLVSSTHGEYEIKESPAGGSSIDRLDEDEFHSCTDGKCIKRRNAGLTGGMWFGPRLGRRRRSGERTEIDQDIETLAEALDGARWALITIPNDRKRTSQFTPRLGRESGEEYASTSSLGNARDFEDEEQFPPPPPVFAPRLGRRLLPFSPSPRLGRQLPSLFQKI